MFAIARTYGPNVGPALNLCEMGWVAWEEFCRCIKTKTPITIMMVGSQTRATYNAGTLDEILLT